MSVRRWLGILVFLSFLGLGFPRYALAEATVLVQVRTPEGKPADGKVTLVSLDRRRYACATQAGSCRIRNVPGGRYEVRFEPAEGAPPPPRQVMIPPQGEVTLIVASDH